MDLWHTKNHLEVRLSQSDPFSLSGGHRALRSCRKWRLSLCHGNSWPPPWLPTVMQWVENQGKPACWEKQEMNRCIKWRHPWDRQAQERWDRKSLDFQVSLHGPQLFFTPKFSAFPNIVSLPLFVVAFQSPPFKFNLSEWVSVSRYLKKSH